MDSDDYVNGDQNATSASLVNQTLLKALRDFIVPLIVQAVDLKGKSDINEISLGPEAGKLITALQEFISSIVPGQASQALSRNMIEVSLVEEENVVKSHFDGNDKGNLLLETSSHEPDAEDVSISTSEDHNTLEKPQLPFHEKLLKALREHVFNTMPIRLLCFESHGSNLHVTLLERGVIHARLASALRANLHKPDHVPILEMETEETEETDDEAVERLISKYARYAIMSHTWLRTESGEVSYADWNKRQFNAKDPGYQKLANFCKIAWKDHGLAFGWMDTVCINKESSAELDESIRSMYNWYRRAYVCIIYLSETQTMSDIYLDTWFTRGWTLQELLAPNVIKFYNGHWKQFVENSYNDRWDPHITTQIEQATTITEDELNHSIRSAPISRRMQLAANREVTREEDMAYSLMGIFDVSISTAYGEGADRAFFRLLQEILISYTDVLDIFNWAGELPDIRSHASSLLPSSPQYYLRRSSNHNLLLGTQPMEPVTLTHLGLRITVILMPAISISGKHRQHDPFGDYNATVDISPVGYYIHIPTTYNVLDKRISGSDGNKGNGWYQITLAVFNFGGNENNIRILKTCAAIGLLCYDPVGNVTDLGQIDTIDTNEPIIFDLGKMNDLEEDNSAEDNTNNDKGNDNDNDDDSITSWNKETYYRVKRSELAKHGMQLLSLRL